ncbi:MAG: DUF177 domain-containing protein [Gemmatimonadetes bacterium]|nr:DUF177 domain-containing protein [Gemmatimonadota bacterium]
MVQVDLLGLRRSGTVPVRGEIASDDDIWAGSELSLATAVQLSGSAAATATGGVVVRGSWRALLRYDCGRCLRELLLEFERPVTLHYHAAHDHSVAELDGDPDVRTVSAHETAIDLAEAIREEVVLEVPRYMVPAEGVDGSCGECGVPVRDYICNRAERHDAEVDVRWSPLAALGPN